MIMSLFSFKKDIDSVSVFDTFLIHHYKKNHGVFHYHSDEEVDINQNKKREFVYIFYLNDVYEGGETEIISGLGIKIKPKKGSLLIFPASSLYIHKGHVPISNDKFIITGWIYSNITE